MVLRTSDETAALPARCAEWAERTGVEVDVVGPVGVGGLPARLAGERYAGAVVELAGVSNDDALAAAIAATAYPVIAVSRHTLREGTSVVEAACAATLAGRGTGGFVWALWHLHALRTHAPRTLSYGRRPAQVGDLRLPEGPGRRATVVLVHGGFWRHEWARDLMDGVAVDLSRRGYGTWNIEYRRCGPTGGGWPHTGDDVVRAVTSLALLAAGDVDLDRLVLLGHSAGAQLALRAAAELRDRHRPPALVVAMSGLFDLDAAAREGVGWGSVETFMGGGPDEMPAAYRDAAPILHVPLGVPQLVVHGTADTHVPYTQTDSYHRRASDAGDTVEVVALEDADHFAVIDPTSAAWAATVAALERHVPA